VVPESKQDTPLLVGAAEAVSSPPHFQVPLTDEQNEALLASMLAESEAVAKRPLPIFGSGVSIGSRSIGSETLNEFDGEGFYLSEDDDQEKKPAVKSDKELAFERAAAEEASSKHAERLAAIQSSQEDFQAKLPPEPFKEVPTGTPRLRKYVKNID
jgi:hypothetical protein